MANRISGLVARKLLETRILTCAAPKYQATHGTPEHLRDLERHECLMFRDPVTGRPFDWVFRPRVEVVAIKAAIRRTAGVDPAVRFCSQQRRPMPQAGGAGTNRSGIAFPGDCGGGAA